MKIIRTFTSESIPETKKIARELADIFKSGDLILMEGDLGSGKTRLVQEICREWHIADDVTSPTFTIIQQYTGPLHVNHMDLYRITDEKELDHLGWEELLDGDSVTFVEWPGLIEPRVDRFYKLYIRLNGQKRIIELQHT